MGCYPMIRGTDLCRMCVCVCVSIIASLYTFAVYSCKSLRYGDSLLTRYYVLDLLQFRVDLINSRTGEFNILSVVCTEIHEDG